MERNNEPTRSETQDSRGTVSLIERRPAAVRINDVALAEPQREMLRSFVLSARGADDAPAARKTASSRPRAGARALFVGGNSAARENAAAAVANELDVQFYRVDLGRVVSKYIGETEKNLNAVFDSAARGGAVLLFDEADALFGKRTDVKDAHDRYANMEVSYLLDRLESYDGVAILATNLKSNIDPAFIRRIRYIVELPSD